MKTPAHHEPNENSRFITIVAGLTATLLVTAFGGFIADRLSGKFNRSNQAAERIAAALERAYPTRTALPRPSLLPVITPPPAPRPNPDPEPCDQGNFDTRLSCADTFLWNRVHLPTLGGTAQ